MITLNLELEAPLLPIQFGKVKAEICGLRQIGHETLCDGDVAGGGGLEFEPAVAVEFEPEGVPPAGAEGAWGAPEACPEGIEAAADCAVDPVGAGVNPTAEDMEAKSQHKWGSKKSRE